MKIHNHFSPRLSELEEEMVADIPPGGNWQQIPSGLSARVDQIKKRSRERGLVHTTYYGRLAWDRPSYTISTYFSRIGNGAFLHPEQLRLISLREGARLQSFPDAVIFAGPRRSQYEQVGNAVPPILGLAVARSLSGGTVVDLFAGAGGLSLGFELAGSTVVLAADRSPHACETFNARHENDLAQVVDLADESAQAALVRDARLAAGGRPDLLLAGPPCQGFSTAGDRAKDDPRSELFWAPFRIAERLRPKTLVVENVQGILSIAKRSMPGRIADEMRRLGYTPSMKVLRADEYGVPQRRTRVFFVGTEGEWNPPEPRFSSKETSLLLSPALTVRDAIGDLPALNPGEGSGEVRTLRTVPRAPYQEWARGLRGVDSMLDSYSLPVSSVPEAA